MKKTLVYLASPFSSKNKFTEECRYEAVTRAAALIKRKYPDIVMFLPITQSYNMVRHIPSLGGSFDKWEGDDLFMVGISDELWILKLPGWDTSIGVNAERDYAKSLGKKIVYINTYDIFEEFKDDLLS